MAREKVSYTMVGRYKQGNEVVAYHLQSLEQGKAGKFSREQVIYLIGRGQVSNCTAQLYKDGVIIRGVGMNLEELPVIQTDGNGNSSVRGVEGASIKKSATHQQILEQVAIVAEVKDGTKKWGFVVRNNAGATKAFTRAQIVKLAEEGRISNARVQQDRGQTLLRGSAGTNLTALPSVQLSQMKPLRGNVIS